MLTMVPSQTGRAHLLLISKTPGVGGGAIGVITLEDVIEVAFCLCLVMCIAELFTRKSYLRRLWMRRIDMRTIIISGGRRGLLRQLSCGGGFFSFLFLSFFLFFFVLFKDLVAHFFSFFT